MAFEIKSGLWQGVAIKHSRRNSYKSEEFIKTNKNIGLIVNSEKTKYIVVSMK